ncbi:MAG TPA: M20 family metallopeptidase [Mycobacteriales bacterium]|nr:M20 family metallopeptidase [Mycobacteriales bacterium]
MLDDAKALQGDLVQLRRTLHGIPELGLQLPRTQEAVLSALDGLPLEVATGESLTSVTAVLRGGASTGGRTVLLRGDMDALPVTERSGEEFAATGDTMHACGHDLHTAMLVGAARLLSAHRDRLAGDVVFMFQPGEEGFDGAAHMIDEGVLGAAGGGVDAAFAIHVTSGLLPAGIFAARPGPLMSAADVLRVTVRGAGGHGSSPHRAKDPIPAACEMVTALQTFVTRRFDIFDPVVITIGAFHAGTVFNVIPDEATFEATVRSFSPEAHARVLAESVDVCRGIAAAHGLEVDAVAEELYPVTVNDGGQVAAVESMIGDVHGEGRYVTLPNPVAGSEDFSRVLDAVPGAMVFLGATPADRDPVTAPFNHSAEAAFDDAVLADGVAVYAEFAARTLVQA